MKTFDPNAFISDEESKLANGLPHYLNYSTLIDLFLERLRTDSAGSEQINIVDYSDNKIIGIQNLSDWHIGKRVVLNNKIVYNAEIAKQRLDSIFGKSLASIKRWKLKKIIVAINGDMVEGGGVNFLQQPYSIDKMVDDQMLIAAEKLWEYLKAVSGMVDKVVVIAVSGNHGRSKIPDPTANFDLVVYRYVYQKMFHQQSNNNYTNIKFYISTELFINYSPYPGLTIHVRHLNRAKQIKTAAGRARFLATCNIHNANVILSGHWHNPTFEMAQNKWNIINGSLVGMDTYAEELTLRSDHVQIFNVFNEDKMIGIELLT